MRQPYHRFSKMVSNAKQCFDNMQSPEKQLMGAVRELRQLHEDDVPEYAEASLNSIFVRCQTMQPIKHETGIEASINAMSLEEMKVLKRDIMAL